MKVGMPPPDRDPSRLSRILPRPRLIRRLQQHKDVKLILILGQAAQGKSTLAASFAGRSPERTVWVNLMPEDSHPANLFHAILHGHREILDKDAYDFLSGYPGTSMGPREEAPFYREWIGALFRRVYGPVLIVLDGLDRLDTHAPSFGFLQALLEESPESVRLLMTSREVPPLDVDRLKMQSQVLILTNTDLAFTLTETRSFFQKLYGLELDGDSLRKIHRMTEGWVGGLVLLAEGLASLDKTEHKRYLDETVRGRFRREVFQYFERNILALQPPAVRDFLVKTSIFEALDSTLLQQLPGLDEAEDILLSFARRNLFVQAEYHERRGWTFRYHTLFRDFLRFRFEAKLGTEQKRLFLVEIGKRLDRAGEKEKALPYLLEVGRYQQAASIIERIGPDAVRKGRYSDVANWIRALPQTIIQERPELLLLFSLSTRFTEVDENILRLQNALNLFEQQGDLRGQLLSMAHLLEALLIRGKYSVPIADLLEKGSRLLHFAQGREILYERGVILAQMGFAYAASGYNPRRGLECCEDAVLIARHLGDRSLEVFSLCQAVNSLSWLGELEKANEISEGLRARMEGVEFVELKYYHLISEMIRLHYGGSWEEAKKLAEKVEREIKEQGLIYMYYIVSYRHCMLNIHLGKFEEARNQCNFLARLTESFDIPILKAIVHYLMSLLGHHTGDFQSARKQAQTSLEVASTTEARQDYLNAWNRLLIGLSSLHLGDDREAERFLRRSLEYSEAMEVPLLQAEARLAMALVRERQGREEEAVEHLKEGFGIAESKKYVRFIGLNAEDMHRACVLALALEVPQASGYAEHLLRGRYVAFQGAETHRLSNHPRAEVRRRALNIRRAIHRAEMPVIRIQTLGGFRVLRGETPIEEDWGMRRQPKTLLKALVARGIRGVPKERLINDLWPEGKSETAERNFRILLHRLRRALEPSMVQALGSSYILLQGGLVSLDPELCHVDLDAFEARLREGADKESKGDRKGALSCYEEALSIYEGDFLPEEPYTPWAMEKREEVVRRYKDLLSRVAAIYEERGALTKAIAYYRKVLEVDPLCERAYQRLMSLHMRRGQKNEARKVYEMCCKALREGLDAEPDELTKALYRKIEEP